MYKLFSDSHNPETVKVYRNEHIYIFVFFASIKEINLFPTTSRDSPPLYVLQFDIRLKLYTYITIIQYNTHNIIHCVYYFFFYFLCVLLANKVFSILTKFKFAKFQFLNYLLNKMFFNFS